MNEINYQKSEQIKNRGSTMCAGNFMPYFYKLRTSMPRCNHNVTLESAKARMHTIYDSMHR